MTRYVALVAIVLGIAISSQADAQLFSRFRSNNSYSNRAYTPNYQYGYGQYNSGSCTCPSQQAQYGYQGNYQPQSAYRPPAQAQNYTTYFDPQTGRYFTLPTRPVQPAESQFDVARQAQMQSSQTESATANENETAPGQPTLIEPALTAPAGTLTGLKKEPATDGNLEIAPTTNAPTETSPAQQTFSVLEKDKPAVKPNPNQTPSPKHPQGNGN